MDDPPVAPQPENVQGDERIFHPERMQVLFVEHEEHPLIGEDIIAEHQPPGPLLVGHGQLRGDRPAVGKEDLDEPVSSGGPAIRLAGDDREKQKRTEAQGSPESVRSYHVPAPFIS